MVDFYGFHVGKYTSPMDDMGMATYISPIGIPMESTHDCHLSVYPRLRRDPPSHRSWDKCNNLSTLDRSVETKRVSSMEQKWHLNGWYILPTFIIELTKCRLVYITIR